MTPILVCVNPDTGEVLAGGKVVGKVVPHKYQGALREAVLAFERKGSYLNHPDVPYKGTVKGDSPEKYQERFLEARYKAMLAASHIDLSAAAVKVPEMVAPPFSDELLRESDRIFNRAHESGYNAAIQQMLDQIKERTE